MISSKLEHRSWSPRIWQRSPSMRRTHLYLWHFHKKKTFSRYTHNKSLLKNPQFLPFVGRSGWHRSNHSPSHRSGQSFRSAGGGMAWFSVSMFDVYFQKLKNNLTNLLVDFYLCFRLPWRVQFSRFFWGIYLALVFQHPGESGKENQACKKTCKIESRENWKR